MGRKRKIALNLKILPSAPEEGLPSVLIEGDRPTLEWFAKLILQHAQSSEDCKSERSAPGPLFSRRTELGFYIHRLPCRNEMAKHDPQQSLLAELES